MSLVESLSEEQRKVLLANGKFVLRACPGSGKTFSVSAKIEELLKTWDFSYQGIAALSFTNVAWKEIEKNLIDHKISFRYPHFIGTIDSFINKYIFLPFGHLVMECCKRPELVGEPYGTWAYPITGKGHKAYKPYFDLFSYDINGNLICIGDTSSCFFGAKWQGTGHETHINNVKEELIKEGYANQSDANFFALKILQSYPEIGKSLVERFPYFIIDEAQDTTEIQMAIIDKLVEYGLTNIILVGDPDQSIYEWNYAKPELFIKKYNQWNKTVLNKNRRSSQVICNYTFNLSSLETSSISVSGESDINPEVVVFDKANINDTIDYFLGLCSTYSIEVNEKNISILFRSKSFIDLFKGTKSVGYGVSKNIWKVGDFWTKEIVKGKYLIDNGDYRTGFKLVKTALIKCFIKKRSINKEDINKFLEKKEMKLLEFRSKVHTFIETLPNTINTKINDFLKAINEANKTLNLSLKEDSSLTIEELFNDTTVQEHKGCRIGTIHSVKGETFEATLLFLNTKVSKNYTTLLKEGNYTSEEEIRNVYVAMTRPRKLLVLAVPNEKDKIAWKQVLELNIYKSELQ